jgi:hypothetical protein
VALVAQVEQPDQVVPVVQVEQPDQVVLVE